MHLTAMKRSDGVEVKEATRAMTRPQVLPVPAHLFGDDMFISPLCRSR
jgi:hypothetical protein